MKILGFLEKNGKRITVFKDKNKYFYHGNEYKVFYKKLDFEKNIYQNKYKFIGVKNDYKRKE